MEPSASAVHAPPPKSDAKAAPPLASPTPPASSCIVCTEAKARYTCPGCRRMVCSVACSKAHKTRFGCNGKRDRTAFVSLTKFNDNTLTNDYHFLEELAAEVAKSHRDPCTKTRPTKVRRKLASNAHKMGMKLRLMPPEMQRARLNKSRWDNPRKGIKWTLELRFPKAGIKVLKHHVRDTVIWKDCIQSAVENAGYARRIKLKQYHEGIDTVKLLYLDEASKTYHRLPTRDTIRSTLTGKTILEFPTIVIVASAEEESQYPEWKAPLPPSLLDGRGEGGKRQGADDINSRKRTLPGGPGHGAPAASIKRTKMEEEEEEATTTECSTAAAAAVYAEECSETVGNIGGDGNEEKTPEESLGGIDPYAMFNL